MFKFLKQLLDWIYRDNCYVCRKPSKTGLLCSKCSEKIELNFPDPIKIIKGINIYSASIYKDEARKIILGLKYNRKKDLAFPIAQILYNFYNDVDISKKNYEIIPVPLHSKREKTRKYNQMELVANELSKLTGYSVNTKLIKRVKETKPLHKLSRKQRQETLKNAFEIDLKEYSGKSLLIIDDICTTGSTLEEIISLMQNNEIHDIFALVMANPE